MAHDWITRGELAELVEHERRRERRAKIRCALIVGASLLFWLLVAFYVWGGQ